MLARASRVERSNRPYARVCTRAWSVWVPRGRAPAGGAVATESSLRHAWAPRAQKRLGFTKVQRGGAAETVRHMPALTPEELFQFDTFGWLHVPAVFKPKEVTTMRQLASDWLAAAASNGPDSPQLPPPLEPYAGPLGNSVGGSHPGARVIKGIYHTQYGHRLFERCACDSRILRVVRALQEDNPCHVNQNLMEIRSDTDERVTFHGNLDPGDRFYEVRGHDSDCDSEVDLNAAGGSSAGRYCFSSLVNVSVSLCDVPAGEGFVSVPGSHRREFSPPKRIEPATMVSTHVRAGDALIFCEALWHSAAPWKSANPRLTVFSRFWAHCADERWRSYHPEERLPYDNQLGDDLRELQRCPSLSTTHHRRKINSISTLKPASASSSTTRPVAVGRLARIALPLRAFLCATGAAHMKVLVTEPAGIRRYKFPVLLQLPYEDGRGTQRLRIVASESHSEIPAQVDIITPLASRPTGIHRRLLNVHFHCSLEAFETRTFMADWVETAAAAMCSSPPLVLNGMRLTVEESMEHRCFIVKNEEAICWTIPLFLRSGISSVIVPPTEYVRQEPHDSDASAVVLTYNDGTVDLFAPTTKGSILSTGPFMVQIRFVDTVSQVSVDLCFPVSRSWCEIIVRQHPDMAPSQLQQRTNQRLVGLHLHGPSLNVVAPTTASPTLCDFGAGTTVYAALSEREAQARMVAQDSKMWRVEQQVGGDGQSDAWTVLQRLSSDAGEGSIGATTMAEGWAHVMDRECCVAIAVAEFGHKTLDSIAVGGDGTTCVERRWDANQTAGKLDDSAGSEEEAMLLRCYYHFVPFPPQRSAATQPQAMLAPLWVRSELGPV